MAYGFDSNKNKVEVVAKDEIVCITTTSATVAAGAYKTWDFTSTDLAAYGITDLSKWLVISTGAKTGGKNYYEYPTSGNNTIVVGMMSNQLRVNIQNTGASSDNITIKVWLMKVE